MSVDSETGRLRSVLLHRPGAELARLTPRNSDRLLFDGIPWVAQAQREHDAFADLLRSHDVEVLYLSELLTETLHLAPARDEVIAAAVADPRLGHDLREALTSHLHGLHPADLCSDLIAGLSRDEFAAHSSTRAAGLSFALMHHEDFVLAPLPNVLFTRDSSVWIGDRVAVTRLAMPARTRETSLTRAIYTHFPRFAGTAHLYEPTDEPLEGGDVLLLAPGVVAIGTGERTTPAGVERLARALLLPGLARVVLAVPVAQRRATMHLDTVCTMVDRDAVVMAPGTSLTAWTLTLRGEPADAAATIEVSGPAPFLQAAATAMGIPALRVIDTALDAVTAEREQWDDGNNTLAIGPRLCVAYERNTATNARLAAAEIEVLAIAGSELGSGRGGPRCMSAPVRRDA